MQKINVIGVGGAALKIINQLIDAGVENNFYVVDCEQQELAKSKAKHVIAIGKETTRGLRTAGDVLAGKRAARENEGEVKEIVSDAELVLLIAGLGGGVGSSVSAEIARLAKEANNKTQVVAVVTTPFKQEGNKAVCCAEVGLKDLTTYTDADIILKQETVTYGTIDFPRADAIFVQYLTELLPTLQSVKESDLSSILSESNPRPYFSITVKKQTTEQQCIRDTANYKSAVELAKREGVAAKEIADITEQPGLSDGAKFHKLLKTIDRKRKSK